MIVAGQRLPILIATKPVDFRCGHNALALIVQTELKLDPHSGVTVVFRSKRGDRLKILVWDGTGLVLTYKVLEQGSFAWPKVQDGVTRDHLTTTANDHLSDIAADPDVAVTVGDRHRVIIGLVAHQCLGADSSGGLITGIERRRGEFGHRRQIPREPFADGL